MDIGLGVHIVFGIFSDLFNLMKGFLHHVLEIFSPFLYLLKVLWKMYFDFDLLFCFYIWVTSLFNKGPSLKFYVLLDPNWRRTNDRVKISTSVSNTWSLFIVTTTTRPSLQTCTDLLWFPETYFFPQSKLGCGQPSQSGVLNTPSLEAKLHLLQLKHCWRVIKELPSFHTFFFFSYTVSVLSWQKWTDSYYFGTREK